MEIISKKSFLKYTLIDEFNQLFGILGLQSLILLESIAKRVELSMTDEVVKINKMPKLKENLKNQTRRNRRDNKEIVYQSTTMY